MMNKFLMLLLLTYAGLGFADKAKEPVHYTIKIVSPTSGETFQNSNQESQVSVAVTPALLEGDQLVISADGDVVGGPTNATTVTIPWLPRGSHTLQAKVIQKDGPGAESEPVTFFQQRTSAILNNKH